jgi:hypothetical protein
MGCTRLICNPAKRALQGAAASRFINRDGGAVLEIRAARPRRAPRATDRPRGSPVPRKWLAPNGPRFAPHGTDRFTFIAQGLAVSSDAHYYLSILISPRVGTDIAQGGQARIGSVVPRSADDCACGGFLRASASLTGRRSRKTGPAIVRGKRPGISGPGRMNVPCRLNPRSGLPPHWPS